MASVPITITGVLFDKYSRTTQLVTLMGEATITGLGVGGGPIIPPEGGSGQPPGIWGPPGPWPGFPPDPGIPGNTPGQPPHIWGPTDPRPTNPISGIPGLPGYTPPLPPDVEKPQPGDPTKPLPPPPGSSGWPVQSMVPPPYIVVNYPGVGPVIVSPPSTTAS